MAVGCERLRYGELKGTAGQAHFFRGLIWHRHTDPRLSAATSYFLLNGQKKVTKEKPPTVAKSPVLLGSCAAPSTAHP